MEFRKVLALRGPNVWSQAPVLEVWLADSAGDELPNEIWRPLLVDLANLAGRPVDPQALAEQMADLTSGRVLKHVLLALQKEKPPEA